MLIRWIQCCVDTQSSGGGHKVLQLGIIKSVPVELSCHSISSGECFIGLVDDHDDVLTLLYSD